MADIPVRHIPTVKKEPDFSGSFNIRDIADLLAGGDMVQELHRHDFFFLLVLEKGTGKHEIDFTSYEIRGHSVFIMRPGQVHQLTLKAGSTGYLMGFNSDFYYPKENRSNQVLRKASNTNFWMLDTQSFNKIYSVLNYIFDEYTQKQPGYQEIIKANLGILFIELLRQRNDSGNSAEGFDQYEHERLDKFLELLETHLVNRKKVSDYADMLNLSAYQLNAITKKILGKTSSEIIDEYIILESKRHLLATSDQVNQVAYHLGYTDVSYFIRFFKKHTGYSPEAFRHNYK